MRTSACTGSMRQPLGAGRAHRRWPARDPSWGRRRRWRPSPGARRRCFWPRPGRPPRRARRSPPPRAAGWRPRRRRPWPGPAPGRGRASGFGKGFEVGPPRRRRGLPARPLASAKTQSLVDMSPSTVRQLKLSVDGQAQGLGAGRGLARWRRCTTAPDHGGELGGDHPGALGTGRRRRTSARAPAMRATAILERVSVVMMASAAESAPGPSELHQPGKAARRFSPPGAARR